MMHKTLDFDLMIKGEPDDEGTFEGLASPFGGPADSYGDVIEAGAYAETLQRHYRSGTMPVMLWSHDQSEPIGIWTEMHEDGKGLYGKGRLIKGVRRADEAHLLMRHKAVRGLSIGYRVLDSQPDGKVTRLKKIDLLEVSIVAIPAASRARITTVKHSDHTALLRNRLVAGDPPSLREWEKGLRDALDLSQSEAEKAVRLCLKGIAQGEPGNAETDPTTLAAITVLRDALKGFSYPRT
jgi:uncharacterized protein